MSFNSIMCIIQQISRGPVRGHCIRNLGWPDYLFYLQKLPDPPRNQLVVPKINQLSYEMVGVKMTETYYGQNNRIFIVMVLKCTYILIIIYTVCTCDTLVPTRILNSEISWFCFDFPKWGPVLFIITDFNVFVQFFE